MVFPSLKWIPETPNFANIFFRSSPWNTFQFSYMNIREFRIQNLGKSKSEMFFPIPHPLQCQRKDFDLAPYNSWQEVGPRWEFCFPYKHNLGFPTYFIPLLIIPWILFLGSFNLLFLRSFELRACPGLGQNHSLGVFVLREGFEFHRKAETLGIVSFWGNTRSFIYGTIYGTLWSREICVANTPGNSRNYPLFSIYLFRVESGVIRKSQEFQPHHPGLRNPKNSWSFTNKWRKKHILLSCFPF